ncbi:MAG: HU family DNA-binding protein, partial [Oscillospiraceae bacterium]|nr:HU family DNA-binding protein [Oscillospiraceae bacterium]
MNRSDLIKIIAKKTGFSIKKARFFVNIFCEILKNQMADGNSVNIRHFGRWTVKTTTSRRRYNISTYRIETLPAKRKVIFSPSKIIYNRTTSKTIEPEKFIITSNSILNSLLSLVIEKNKIVEGTV